MNKIHVYSLTVNIQVNVLSKNNMVSNQLTIELVNPCPV